MIWNRRKWREREREREREIRRDKRDKTNILDIALVNPMKWLVLNRSKLYQIDRWMNGRVSVYYK